MKASPSSPSPCSGSRLGGRRAPAGQCGGGPGGSGAPCDGGFPGRTFLVPLLPLGPSPCPLLPPSSCPPETLALRPARRPPRGLLLGAPCSWCWSQRWPKPTPSDVPTGPQSTTSRTATCPQPSKCRGVSLTCQRHPGSRSPRPPGRQGTQPGSGQSPPRSSSPVGSAKAGAVPGT